MRLKPYKPCAALLTLILFVAATSLFAAEPAPPANTLALVNGMAITKAQLDMELKRVEKQAQMNSKPISDRNKIKKELLETLINRELLYQESLKKGYAVQPAELDSEFETIKARFADQKGFQQALTDMDISEEDFKEQVK